MKRLITILICLLLCTNSVYAEDTYTEGYYYYILEDGSITITGYFGDEEVITIPDNIAGYPVNGIGAHAFEDADSIKKANLPATVTAIGENAFKSGVVLVYAGENVNDNETGEENNDFSSPIINNEQQDINKQDNSSDSSNEEKSQDEVVDSVDFDEDDVDLDSIPEETFEETITNKAGISKLVFVVPGVIILGAVLILIIKKR